MSGKDKENTPALLKKRSRAALTTKTVALPTGTTRAASFPFIPLLHLRLFFDCFSTILRLYFDYLFALLLRTARAASKQKPEQVLSPKNKNARAKATKTNSHTHEVYGF
jgi:hypothetical protein